jgi:hypothetical protein
LGDGSKSRPPQWTNAGFDHDPVLAKKGVGQILDADNPDPDVFAKRSGKVVVYQGWADGYGAVARFN